MADEEPESQIVSFYNDGDNEYFPSSPPNKTCMDPPNAGIGHLKPPASDDEPESQLETHQPESCASRVEDTQFVRIEEETQLPDSNTSRIEDTQFVSVEPDTQTVDDANFSTIHRDSQSQKSNTKQASHVTEGPTAPLLSRPDVGGIDDLASGFTFGHFQKPVKGMFNRPALNQTKSQRTIERSPDEAQPISFLLNSQHVAKRPTYEDPPNGAMESLLPNIPAATAVQPYASSSPTSGLDVSQKLATVAIQPDASFCLTSIDHSSLGNSMVGSNIRTGDYVDANHAHYLAQQEVVPVPVTTNNSQTANSDVPAGALAQKSANKSHKRVKKPFGPPFPEEVGPPSNQGWHRNVEITSVPPLACPLGHAQQRHTAASTVAHTSAALIRQLGSSVDGSVNNVNCSHHSAPSLEPSRQDLLRPSSRSTISVAQEQQIIPTQNVRSTSTPLHHISSVWDANKQTISQKLTHSSEPKTGELQPDKTVQQFDNQLQHNEPPHGHSSHISEPNVQVEPVEHPEPLETNIQAEVSKYQLADIQLNGMGWTHVTGSRVAGVSEIGNPQDVSMHNHGQSRPPSEVPSRPHSRRSNCGALMTRPVSAQALRPQSALEAASQRGIHSTKIKKSGNVPNNSILSEASVRTAAMSGQERQTSGPRPKFFQEYKAFLANGQQLLEIIEGYEQQSQLLEAQKIEIEKLRDASDFAINQIRALESEKAGLTDKLKKFAELSSKYKNHMNDVVKAQKYLKSQAHEIKKSTNEAMESTRFAVENRATLQKIEKAVENAKNLRVSAEEFAQTTKQNQNLEAANQELREGNHKLQKGVQEIREEAQKLRNDNEQLTNDNKKLQIDFGAATKNYELLQTTLDKRLMELAHEKHQVEQLEKARADPQDSYKVLAELLQKTPKDVTNELTKEDGFLAKIFDLEKTTQAKVNEVAILSSTFQKQETKPSAFLNKTIEDLFSRFENSMQASNNGAAAQQESYLKLLDDFKVTVNQLSLDKENEMQLKNRIVELSGSNDTLVIEKNAREREVQGLTNQLDELKRDLAECRGQLSAKNDELTTILAAPKEDPRLRAQIQDLERARNTVAGQLEGANRELVKFRGELSSFQELARRKDQQTKEWEQKHNDAQSRVRLLQEEKTKLLASKQQEIETACQEERQRIARAAESSKATMKMKLESEVSHLEQQVKEKDAELVLAKEELQKAQDKSDACVNNANSFQREVLHYKEQFKHQVAHLKRLEEQNPGQEASDRLAENLQSLRNECTELRNNLDSIRSQNSQNVEVVLRGQQAIEESLRQINTLENENEELKHKNAEWQKRAERWNEAHNQDRSPHAGHCDEQQAIGGSKNIAFATSEEMLRPSKQTQNTRFSSARSTNLEYGSRLRNDRVLDGHRVETPEGALRKAIKDARSLKSGSQVGNVSHGSSLNFTDDSEIPLIRNQGILKEGSTNFNTPNAATGVYDSSSAPHSHRLRSGTRTLKVAARKPGFFVQSNGSGAAPLQSTIAENPTPSFHLAGTSNGTSLSATMAPIQESSGITLFATLASSFPTPSPYTDLSSMMNELGSVPDQEQLQNGYAKARGKKESAANTSIAGIGGLHTFAMDHGNSISTEEEARRRRTAQPRKSSIKKAKATNESIHTSELRPVATAVKDTAHAESKAAFQFQSGGRSSYNRAVSGSKPQTPKTSNPSTAGESTQRPWISANYSPNMPPLKRNKRVGSSTAQTQGVPKRIRTSRGSSLADCLEVADSQDQSTF